MTAQAARPVERMSASETIKSLGELRQGVTTQIFGESSMGPLSEEMRKTNLASQGDIKFDIPWTTLAEYQNRQVGVRARPRCASVISAPPPPS